MKSGTLRLSVMLTVLVGTALSVLPVGPAEAQWVFLARRAVGRIHHMAEANQPDGRAGYDFATAVQMARKNPAVRVVAEDPGQRRLQVAEGDRSATLNVVPFSDDVSQLLIAGHAGPGEGPTASLVVQSVLRICKEMGKHCEVGGG